jgi:hypothetical protein
MEGIGQETTSYDTGIVVHYYLSGFQHLSPLLAQRAAELLRYCPSLAYSISGLSMMRLCTSSARLSSNKIPSNSINSGVSRESTNQHQLARTPFFL